MSQFKTLALRLMIGANTFKKVIEPHYYTKLKGGVLEAFGRLFAQNLKVYLYPALDERCEGILTSENLPVDESIKSLYRYLLESGRVVDVTQVKTQWLHIHSHEVLNRIIQKDATWEEMVPKYVSKFIKDHKVFDYSE